MYGSTDVLFSQHSDVLEKTPRLLEASLPCLYIYKIEIHTVELTGQAN